MLDCHHRRLHRRFVLHRRSPAVPGRAGSSGPRNSPHPQIGLGLLDPESRRQRRRRAPQARLLGLPRHSPRARWRCSACPSLAAPAEQETLLIHARRTDAGCAFFGSESTWKRFQFKEVWDVRPHSRMVSAPSDRDRVRSARSCRARRAALPSFARASAQRPITLLTRTVPRVIWKRFQMKFLAAFQRGKGVHSCDVVADSRSEKARTAGTRTTRWLPCDHLDKVRTAVVGAAGEGARRPWLHVAPPLGQ
jgi:hypothetical protein